MYRKEEELYKLEFEKYCKKVSFQMNPNTLTYLEILEIIRRMRYLEGKLRN